METHQVELVYIISFILIFIILFMALRRIEGSLKNGKAERDRPQHRKWDRNEIEYLSAVISSRPVGCLSAERVETAAHALGRDVGSVAAKIKRLKAVGNNSYATSVPKNDRKVYCDVERRSLSDIVDIIGEWEKGLGGQFWN